MCVVLYLLVLYVSLFIVVIEISWELGKLKLISHPLSLNMIISLNKLYM